MRIRAFALALAALLLLGQLAVQAADPAVTGLTPEQLKQYDEVVGKAMAAYNAGDAKAFYRDWAKQMESITTAQAFQSLYVGMYKKQYGNFKARTLVPAKSVFSDMNGLLVYDAQFDKGKATLSVNFFKEGDVYKIQQIRIDPPQ